MTVIAIVHVQHSVEMPIRRVTRSLRLRVYEEFRVVGEVATDAAAIRHVRVVGADVLVGMAVAE